MYEGRAYIRPHLHTHAHARARTHAHTHAHVRCKFVRLCHIMSDDCHIVTPTLQLRAFSSKVSSMLENEMSSSDMVRKLGRLSKVMAAVRPVVMRRVMGKIDRVNKMVLATFKDSEMTREQVRVDDKRYNYTEMDN